MARGDVAAWTLLECLERKSKPVEPQKGIGPHLNGRVIAICLEIRILQILDPDDMRDLPASADDVRLNMQESRGFYVHINRTNTSVSPRDGSFGEWIRLVSGDITSCRQGRRIQNYL